APVAAHRNSRSHALAAWSGALIDVTDDSRRNSGIPAPGATETHPLALAVLARAAQKMRRRIAPRKFLGARHFPLHGHPPWRTVKGCKVMWPGLPGERGPGHVIWVLWGLDPSTTDCQGCAHTGHQQYCGKCGIDPDISSGVGKVVPWSTRLLGWVGGFLLRGVLTIGAELMRPLSSS